MSPRRRLALFAKAPVQGTVKTRLAADIGDHAALAVHTELLERTARTLTRIPGHELWMAGDASAFDTIAALVDWPRYVQTGDDLGERMANAFDAGVTLLVGSDIPGLDIEYLRHAHAALADHDVVLGPTEDGGYCLVGMNEPHAELFDAIEWSTSRVLAQTLDRCRPAGLEVALLAPLWDVDTLTDYQRAKRMNLVSSL